SAREHARRPSSERERQIVGRFADAVESGDVDELVALLTDDALLTMPPQPLEFQGHAAIGAFLAQRQALRGGPFRIALTRANTQPAMGCYFPGAGGDVAKPYGLIVLTLTADAISAITWFSDTALFARCGLPEEL